MRKLLSFPSVQRNRRNPARQQQVDDFFKLCAGCALIPVRICQLDLLGQQRAVKNIFLPVADRSNFILDQLHAVLQGHLQAFAEQVPVMVPHDHKDRYADQRGHKHQYAPRDQAETEQLLVLFVRRIFMTHTEQNSRVLKKMKKEAGNGWQILSFGNGFMVPPMKYAGKLHAA